MSSASTLDQKRKEVFCYCCCCQEKLIRSGGVRPGGTQEWPPVHHYLWLPLPDRLPDHGQQEQVRETVRRWQWSGLVLGKQFLFNRSLPSGRPTPPALSQGQSPPLYSALDILPVKGFPAPGGKKEQSSSPIFWMLSSQWKTARYMQYSNGGKISQVFGKELNAPSLLPGPTEERWAGTAKFVTQSFQIHWWTRDAPPHK